MVCHRSEQLADGPLVSHFVQLCKNLVYFFVVESSRVDLMNGQFTMCCALLRYRAQIGDAIFTQTSTMISSRRAISYENLEVHSKDILGCGTSDRIL